MKIVYDFDEILEHIEVKIDAMKQDRARQLDDALPDWDFLYEDKLDKLEGMLRIGSDIWVMK